jgi:gluconate 2-dehydrogenase gamma chain
MKLTRRQAASAAAAAAVMPAQTAPLFSEAQRATITWMADYLIPPDDTPGAGQAGAAEYLDRQLRGPLKRFLQPWRAGLAALDQAAGGSFLGLGEKERGELLESIGGGRRPELRGFFEMALDQVMQSYFGDPKYGGNRGEASWKAMGIEDMMHSRTHHGGKK